MAYGKARTHHAADNDQCGDNSRAACIDELLEAEFQTEGEEEHHDAYLGPVFDIAFGCDGGDVFEIGAGKESGHNVAEHHGLFEPFEEEGGDGSEYENEGEVGDKAFDVEFGRGFGRCGSSGGEYHMDTWLASDIDCVLRMAARLSNTFTISVVFLVSTTRLSRVRGAS